MWDTNGSILARNETGGVSTLDNDGNLSQPLFSGGSLGKNVSSFQLGHFKPNE
jgi:hypothetical protein